MSDFNYGFPFYSNLCWLLGLSDRTPGIPAQAPRVAVPVSTGTANGSVSPASGIAVFWQECTFSPSSAHAGYEFHRISLAQLGDAARDALAGVLEHHYIQPAAFRGGDGAVLARVLEARLPDRSNTANAKKDRAGDIGELLGIEWLRHRGGKTWEVCCTLRWKESIRPRRGEDIVAVRWDQNPVGLLKGEAKAGQTIASTTIAEARARLNQDGGWPAPFTIDFLAAKLEADGRAADAARLFEERFKVTPRPADPGCTHLLFLFCSEDPSGHLSTHGTIPAGNVHGQIAAILLCPHYTTIRDNLHNRAIELVRAKPSP